MFSPNRNCAILILATLLRCAVAQEARPAFNDPQVWQEDEGDPVYMGYLLYENPLIRLEGVAKGGVIEVVDTFRRMEGRRYIVETKPGETGEEVTARIRQTMLDSSDFGPPGDTSETKRENLFRSFYGIGGTESGFGFTPTPRALAGFVDWKTSCVHYKWRNAPDYNVIAAPTAYPHRPYLAPSADHARYPVLSLDRHSALDPGEEMVVVYAYQGWRPSAPAHIEIDRCTFRETADAPHVLGLHPNWQRVDLPGQAAPSLSRAPKLPPEEFKSALVRPAKDAPQEVIYAYIQGRDLESVARKEFRLAQEAREAESARIRKSRGSRLDKPEEDKSYQSLRIPSGVAAIYRPVLVTPADRHEVGLRLKFDVPGLSVERAPARVRLLAHVGAAYSVDEAVRKFVASGTGADPAAFGLAELASLGPGSLPADWTDYTSAAKFGDEGILIPGGAEEMSLVVLAENLGDIELGIDWFWCRKLNCSDEIPQGWDPYRVE